MIDGTHRVFVCPACGRVKDARWEDGSLAVRRLCGARGEHTGGRRVLMVPALVSVARDRPVLAVEA